MFKFTTSWINRLQKHNSRCQWQELALFDKPTSSPAADNLESSSWSWSRSLLLSTWLMAIVGVGFSGRLRKFVSFVVSTVLLVGNGSSMNNSSLPWTASMCELTKENGAVGRVTPILTGAISESHISHSSSTAMLIRAWNTRRHLIKGWDTKLQQRMG